jgi:hypothetical protein
MLSLVTIDITPTINVIMASKYKLRPAVTKCSLLSQLNHYESQINMYNARLLTSVR